MEAVFSPRVVGPFQPDVHSLEAMLADPRFADKQGEELVMAVYNYLTSPIDGTYHFWPHSEREGQPCVRRSTIDPIKILNVYGWAICGQMAYMLLAIWTQAGLGGRCHSIPGHALCEVFYDGRWHHVDVDMWTWFRAPEGHIAGAFELAKNARALIVDSQDKSSPCNLPDRDLESYAAAYAKAEVGEDDIASVQPDWRDRSHNTDFHLRPGETLIRTQENQGRFIFPAEWLQMKEQYAREWHGQPRERYGLLRTFGNGRWIYRPNLSSRYADFAAGVLENEGVRQNEAGVVGPGRAVFRIQSPYPFAGIPDDRNGRVTTSGGVWLEIAGQGHIVVEVNGAEGEWRTVCDVADPVCERVDITSLLNARYDCLIRIALGEKALLERFGFEGFVMVAPISVPRLVEGENAMELRLGDKHGLATVPWREVVDFRDTADLPGQWVAAENCSIVPFVPGWNMIAPAVPVRPVEVTYRLAAPKGWRLAWVYLLTAHKESPAGQPVRRAFTEWSLDGRDWFPLSEREISRTTAQWDCSLEGEVLLPNRPEGIYVRISSDTAICTVEATCHLATEGAGAGEGLSGGRGMARLAGDLWSGAAVPSRLEVTHSWKESGVVRRFRVPVGQANYTIVCGRDPYAHAITMAVPSLARVD